jgi:TonB-linked SusC/RagA family outer membrane protein
MRRTPVFIAALALLWGAPLQAQERAITGQVTAADQGQGLPDAVVQVVGTAFATISDADGDFQVRSPTGEVQLRVTLIGYRTAEMTVGAGESNVMISMASDLLLVEGIVVTGRATAISKRNLANAVGTVESVEFERAPAETIEKQLTGKVAGALIETNSGAPGGGVQVRLRGTSTINGASEPLYVVDGVIVSNAAIPSNQNAITLASGGSNPSLTQDALVNRIVDLNPEDIERIEVLKGASAAASYGSKAANGVVIITTKRGTPGDLDFRLSQRFGMFSLSNKLGSRTFQTEDDVMNAFGQSGVDLWNQGQTFDNEELLAGRNSLSSETVFSVNGGTQNTRFFASGLWKSDEGIVKNTGFKKQSFRLNLEQRLFNSWTLRLNSNVIHTEAERGLTNNDNSGTSWYMVFPFTPNFVSLQREADGTYPDNPFERSNPLQTSDLLDNVEDVWRFITAANLQFDIANTSSQQLRARINTGVDYFAQKNSLFSPPELQYEPNDGLIGTSLLSNSSNLNLNIDANLVHTYTGSSYTATTSGGFQYERADLDVARITSQNLIAGQPNVDAGTVKDVSQTRILVKDIGGYAQSDWLLADERLLVSAGLRADKSSANGDPGQWFWYPKAASSYRFVLSPGGIEEIKIRGAWGQSGNRPLFGQKFTPLDGTQNVQGIPGIIVGGQTGDEGLKPERQSEFEAGIDVIGFDGSASLELTAYQKNISDLLLQRTLAPSSGFTTEFFNGGKLQVRGIEAALATTFVNTQSFQWIFRTTYFLDRSEIKELPVPSFRTGGFGTSLGSFQIEVGESATQIVTNLGKNPDGSQIVGAIGNANPDFKWSFVNDFSFGNFNIYALVDWQQGGTVVNLTKLLYDFGQNYVDHDESVEAFDLGDGTMIEGPLGAQRLGRWLNGDSRGYFEDASYLKWRELALTYTFPRNTIQGWFGAWLDNFQIRLGARNLLVFTGYSGLDPEVSNFGNQAVARNIDVAPFPPSRSFWLSFDLGF